MFSMFVIHSLWVVALAWIDFLWTPWRPLRAPVRIDRTGYPSLQIGQQLELSGVGRVDLVDLVHEDKVCPILLGERRFDGKKFALRIYFEQSIFEREQQVLERLQGAPGFPILFAADSIRGILVIEWLQLSSNFYDWRVASPATKMLLSQQLLDRIQTIHSRGYIAGPALVRAHLVVAHFHGVPQLYMYSGFHRLLDAGTQNKYEMEFLNLYLCPVGEQLMRAPSRVDDFVRMVYFLIDGLYANLPWKNMHFLRHNYPKLSAAVLTSVYTKKKELPLNKAFFKRHNVFPELRSLLLALRSRNVDLIDIRSFLETHKYRHFHNRSLPPIGEDSNGEDDDCRNSS